MFGLGIAVVSLVVAVVVQNIIHEAVVYAAFSAGNQTMRAAYQPPVRKLAWTFVTIAAAFAERDQALGEIPSARHGIGAW